jgi:predicted SprT family Zn-dependent metalloprotease
MNKAPAERESPSRHPYRCESCQQVFQRGEAAWRVRRTLYCEPCYLKLNPVTRERVC